MSFCRLQIPVASHRHFSSLARRLGRIFAHAYFHHREAFEQAEAESSLYARFLALTERFDLVPAEFLVIPMDGSNVGGGGGEALGLGHPPSRTARDDHRRPNEFDRGYHHHQQPQQRTGYDLDLGKFHHQEPSSQHPLHPERNSSPPGPSSPESSPGGIGESPSPSSKARFGRLRTGTMVFAEPEAIAVTDELAARSSIREREREPQKIELLERVGDPLTLNPAAVSVHEDDEFQFEISLSPEEVIENSGGGGGSSVAPEVLEESLELAEKHEIPSLLDLSLELEAAGNTVELASAPAEPEANISAESSSHPSMDLSNPVEKEKEVAPTTSDIVADQPKEEPAASVEPAASTEVVKSDKNLETLPIPTEATPPTADANISIPEPTLIPKEIPNPEATTTKLDVVDDKEIIRPSVADDGVLPTDFLIVPVPVETVEAPPLVESEVKTKPEPEPEEQVVSPEETHSEVVPVIVVEPTADVANAATKEKKEEEKPSVVDSTGEVQIAEEKKT